MFFLRLYLFILLKSHCLQNFTRNTKAVHKYGIPFLFFLTVAYIFFNFESLIFKFKDVYETDYT